MVLGQTHNEIIMKKGNDNKTALIKCQTDADEERQGFMSVLSESDKNKYKIVEDTVQKFADEGIKAYIYAALPHPLADPNVPTVYQYNTLASFVKYNKDGSIRKKSADDLSAFNQAMWVGLFNTITKSSLNAKEAGIADLSLSDKDECDKIMEYFMSFVYTCLYEHFQRIKKSTAEE